MKTLQSRDNLIWIDLEMTGLDPNKEKIIEIATLITDSQLNIIAEGPNLIINQPVSLLDANFFHIKHKIHHRRQFKKA